MLHSIVQLAITSIKSTFLTISLTLKELADSDVTENVRPGFTVLGNTPKLSDKLSVG